ncbi:MAG: dockerin type I domain-containing protein, partial [Bacteroidota bacterium]
MNRKNLLLTGLFFSLLGLLLIFYWPKSAKSIVAFDPVAHLEEKHRPADHFFLQRAFPDDHYDVKAYKKSLRKINRERRDLLRSNNTGGFASDWTVQGPGNTGARVNTIAVHPSNEDTIYAGYSAGGIFKTTDGGANWLPIFDEQAYLSIGDIVLDPNDPEIVYVGTGDPAITGYPFIGDGIYKSLNGGQTWLQMGLSELGIISKIEIDPSNSDIVYAASMGLPFERNSNRGIYKSLNGGTSWTQIFNIDDSTGVIDLLIHPDNPQILFAAGWTRIRNNQESLISSVGPKIFRSIDGGSNWFALDGGLPLGLSSRAGLAMSPSDPNVIFALYISANFDLLGIYRSNDAGETWAEISNSSSFGLTGVMGGMGWYFGRMRVHPTNNQQLYLLGVRALSSPNGGGGWTNLTPTNGPNAPHVDNHELVFGPSGSIYLGTDGGIYKRSAGTNTWVDIENIPNTQVYRTAYNPHEPQLFYAGTQDNGTNSGNALTINNWAKITGADGFQMAFHPDDPDISYVETQNGNILVTTNGSAYQIATFGIDPSDRKNWDMQYILSHHDPSILYTGTQRMYKNTNSGISNWFPISDDLTDGNIHGAGFHTISTLDESPHDSLTIYCGTTDANVWRSLDGGDTWERIDAVLPERYVTCIKAAPDAVDQVYVSFSGYKDNDFSPRIYHSTDRGNAWTAIHGNLPDLAINDILVMPNHAGNVLFVATDGGVYATLNAGQDWQRLGGNLPVIPVYDLALNVENNLLVAATFARSVQSFPLDSIGVSVNPPATFALGGSVLSEENDGIELVGVNISDGLEDSQITDAMGGYLFPAIPLNTNCLVQAEKDINPTNGVNIVDVFLMQQHILNINPLTSPYRMIAADVNQSGSINIVDVFELQKLILFIDTNFSNNTSWRFVRADHEFDDPSNPWSNPIPETYSCAELAASGTGNFIGLKVGDLNVSASLAQFQSGDSREKMVLRATDQSFEAGHLLQVDFHLTSQEALSALQLDVQFDSDFLTLQSHEWWALLAEDFLINDRNLDKGQLMGMWSSGQSLDLEEEVQLL